MKPTFHSYDADWVAAVRAGGPDDYGRAAERAVSDGGGNPCRNCLNDIEKGAPMLICAARPFDGVHPYAETGPVFLHAEECGAWAGDGLPPIIASRPEFLLKAYSAGERIVEGTGQVTRTEDLFDVFEDLFARPEVAFIDLRSASNNCFLTRIKRG